MLGGVLTRALTSRYLKDRLDCSNTFKFQADIQEGITTMYLQETKRCPNPATPARPRPRPTQRPNLRSPCQSLHPPSSHQTALRYPHLHPPIASSARSTAFLLQTQSPSLLRTQAHHAQRRESASAGSQHLALTDFSRTASRQAPSAGDDALLWLCEMRAASCCCLHMRGAEKVGTGLWGSGV